MSRINVIFISSVLPEETSGGQIVLYRHLVKQKKIDLQIFGREPQRRGLSFFVRRLMGRLQKSVLKRFVEDFWVLWRGRWLDPALRNQAVIKPRSVVVTVAHADGAMAAMRFAKAHQLPLVTFFHDWWPDMAAIHQPVRRILDKQFQELYNTSHIPLCVCEGMLRELGEHPSPEVILPIPGSLVSSITEEQIPRSESSDFLLVYAGNLGDYGGLLEGLFVALKEVPGIRLEVRGNNPSWSPELRKELREQGLWLDFAQGAELEGWLSRADAFLIPQLFDQKYRRRMRTSFPSKIAEFSKYGKPMIAWGPEDCSSIQWAKKDDRGLCIVDRDAFAVVEAVLELSRDASRMRRFGDQAKRSANSEFCPQQIQTKFEDILVSATVSPDFDEI